MKLIVPEGTSAISHDGVDLEIVNGMIDVEGETFDTFHNAHGFKTEAEAKADHDAAGAAAALAASVSLALSKKK